MASIFPDTSVNNPDTGFGWADGDIWNDPDSGLTYSWYNPVWKTGGAGAEGNFVQVSGDNMTGNLTLGTDKITLDATAGNASFAGDVIVNANAWADDDSVGITLRDEGQVAARRASSSTAGVFTGYAVGVSAATSAIYSDGSASFSSSRFNIEQSGKATIVLDATGGDTNALDLYLPNGSLNTSHFLRGINGVTETITLNGDGSATFAGSVVSGNTALNVSGFDLNISDGTDNVAQYSAGSGLYIGNIGANSLIGNSAIQLNEDGSATFKNETTVPYLYVRPSLMNVSGANEAAWSSFRSFNFSGIQSSGIYADGSASFAGSVQSGDDPNNGIYVGCKLYGGQGTVAATASGSVNVWAGYSQGTTNPTSTISKDGTATFSGALVAGTDTSVQYGVQAYSGATSGVAVYARRQASGGYVFSGVNSAGNNTSYITDTGAAIFSTVNGASVLINLEADDDTKYTSTTDVDEEGNETVTRVYNGEVLDVKDRIQNVLARMDAIEANEITDDATDSALLTLIASLSTRLDERDAQIAALTARVSTLES